MTTRLTGSKKSLSVADTLREAQRFAEAGQLDEALGVIKGIKALDPRNVYVLAFEKQVEQLINLGRTGALTQEQRSDILESIPGIVDRAIEGASVASSESTSMPAAGSPAATRDDKAAALEWLKDQYFQHAHEYVQKGEHEHALAEIRRVYIIDPNNLTARDFERRVMQLAGFPSSTSSASPSQRQLRLVTKESLANEPLPADDAEPILMKTEEWSSPVLEEVQQQIPEERPQTAEEPVHEAQPHVSTDAQEPHPKQTTPHTRPVARRGLRPVTTVVLLLAVIAVGATVFMLWTHRETAKRSEQRLTAVNAAPQQEVFIGAPTVEERNFVVSSSDDPKTGTPQVSEDNPSPTPKVEIQQPRAEQRPAKEPSKSSKASSRKAAEKPKPLPVKGIAAATVTAAPAKETLPQPSPSTTTQQAPVEQSAPPTPVIQKEAQIIKLERPRFSEEAFATGIKGQVVVQVQIDAAGKPVQTKVLQSNNAILVTPVVEAIMKSQFAPAQMSSGPVTSWLTIPFKFSSK